MLINDGGDLDSPALFIGVELEPHCPPHVRSRGRWGINGGDAAALAPPTHRDPESFFAPEPLDLLMVDHPAMGLGPVVGPPIPAPGVLFRVVAQPLAQISIRICIPLGL